MDLSDSTTQEGNLPIGVDDYKDLIDEGYIYVDKTLLIKEFWKHKSKVTLVARPRRFGKSISLSMLRYFFEKTEQSTAYLFERANIWKEKGFKELQGTYPIIHISFKDIKATTWEKAYQKLKTLLAKEVYRTLHSLEPTMNDYYRSSYEALIKETAGEARFEGSLLFITEVFKEYYHKNTIILLDEYDAPITHAYLHNFYEQMIEFMRNLLSPALKGNPHLHRGFMTGVVRTAKDGIMSGLNNPKICTMLDKNFSDKFGFTQNEVEKLLLQAGRLDQKEEVKAWYNGYVIGAEYLATPTTRHYAARVYNPWSIINYLEGAISPKPYWVNTGSTRILERLIEEASDETQKSLKILLEGKALENKQINQDVILLDLDKKYIEPWSFLFFAGYLTATKHTFQDNEHSYTLAVPNEEITKLYKELVTSVINKSFTSNRLKELLKALITGDIGTVNKLLEEFLNSLCSYHDLPHDDLERSLHLFVLGLLASLSEKYVIKSNLESGTGRADILMYPKHNCDLAVVLELKKGTKAEELDSLSSQALEQIKEKKYCALVKEFGYQGKILCYGIAVFKKKLLAKLETIEPIN